jgi:molybdopterin adenylyltransferase
MGRMTSEHPATAAVVTVSDGVTHGTRADASGDLVVAMLGVAGFDVAAREVVPDERDRIEEALRRLAQDHDLIVTTGGTGFGPRDVTPEATRAVIDREAPGIAELMRAAGLAATPMAALSRAVVGVLGSTMVLNLPGSPKGVRESLEAAMPVVPHAVDLLRGAAGAHPTGHRGSATAVATLAARVEAKVVRLIGDPPCRLGNAMTIVPGGEVHGTLGCAEFDDAAVRAAAEIAAAGEPTLRTLTHDLGEIEVFFEPVVGRAPAIVVSATDVARALRRHLEALGYEPVLVEPREERIARSDGAHVRGLDDVELRADAVAVLTDHDAPGVTELLAALLRSPVRFVGVMGSRRHVGHYVEELRGRGFTDEELARIRSPLGLDIGGRSPEEIALSIAAGIVADRHGRDGGWLDR